MSQSFSRETFQQAYAGQPPWDIDHPQPAFVAAADLVQGHVLDVGCGTGENSLFFAARGLRVYGIDFVEQAIRQAEAKSLARRVYPLFLTMDALTLDSWPVQFDTALDCGLFHVFDDEQRARYARNLTMRVMPGGALLLLCFSDEEPPGEGPRRVAKHEIRQAFSDGWRVESIEPSRFEVVPGEMAAKFSDGGPKAWFAVLRRT